MSRSSQVLLQSEGVHRGESGSVAPVRRPVVAAHGASAS